MGPAGSGKSTYCQTIQEHTASLGKLRRRTVHVANLDFAAETFKYENIAFDVRELITVEDVMEELGLGPNGALLYCMEYLLENLDWLREQLEQFDDEEEYLILDCPGQLELYTHVPVMNRILNQMRNWGFEGKMVSVFVLDATFICDASKFISGALLSLSAMIALELPHINILSKCDLVDKETIDRVLDVESATELWHMEEENVMRASGFSTFGRSSSSGGAIDLSDYFNDDNEAESKSQLQQKEEMEIIESRRRRHRLTTSICSVLDDFSMVSFLPLNITDEDSIDLVLMHVDNLVQYGENAEVRGADFDDFGNNGNDDEE